MLALWSANCNEIRLIIANREHMRLSSVFSVLHSGEIPAKRLKYPGKEEQPNSLQRSICPGWPWGRGLAAYHPAAEETASKHLEIRKRHQRAASHRDLYAPKADLFPQYCIKNPRQASALPWILSLSCRKISRFGVLRSFEQKISSHRTARGRGNTLCISRTMDFLWRESFLQNRVNPYVRPPKVPFF